MKNSKPKDNKELTRIQLILIAREVFSKYGFKKSTLDDIAISAGKGKSSLYYYFSSKEEIFDAVVDYEAQILKKRFTDVINRFEKQDDQLKAFIKERMIAIKELMDYYSALKSNYIANIEFIEKARTKFEKFEKVVVYKIVARGKNNGIFRPELKTEHMVIELLAALKGLEFVLLDLSFEELTYRINRIIEILFNGITKK